MTTKVKIFLGLIVINLFGLFGEILEITMCISFGLFFIWLLFKFFSKNNSYKYKVSVAQDFLKHKYGEKMGNYILNESLKNRKNNRKHGGK